MEATTRIIDLTVGELQMLIASEVAKSQQRIVEILPSRLNQEAERNEGILYGLEGMCQALGCSKSKVARMKAEGKLEGGYQQYGNTIVVKDAQALRDIAEMSERKARNKGRRTAKSII